MSVQRITISYPPDFDGETHIDCIEDESHFKFVFGQSKRGIKGNQLNSWQALVQVAQAILDQDERINKAKKIKLLERN